MPGFIVRPAKPADCEQIAELIKELAVYEKLEDQCQITAEVLKIDGFGDEQFYHCFVAQTDQDSPIVGYVMYYYAYSPWKGRVLYLEDLYVKPEFRGRGIGTQLWKSITEHAIGSPMGTNCGLVLVDLFLYSYETEFPHCLIEDTKIAEIGIEKNCKQVQWVVLNWNTPSIEFYKRKGSVDITATEKWHVFRLNTQDMHDFVGM